MLVLLLMNGGSGETAQPTIEPPPNVTIMPTRPIPTPEPQDPRAVVIAPSGVNVRTGPGTVYPVLLTAPFGATGELVGVSLDSTWWVVSIPGAPYDQGWVAAEYVKVENAEGLPVMQPPPVPPTPTPAATATPTATPAPNISFSANRTTINAGESATLQWSVQNVKAVYMFPVGANPFDYPVTGQGSRDVSPGITSSYELRVINPDDSATAQRIEITVIGGLTSGRWVLQSYSTPSSGFMSALPGTTARFATDGSLSGSGGCNSYGANFTAYDTRLAVSNVSPSMAMCTAPDGIMEQENTFFALLQQARSFRISAGQLEVFGADGNRSMTFVSG
jgi:heat shock protein HslJ